MSYTIEELQHARKDLLSDLHYLREGAEGAKGEVINFVMNKLTETIQWFEGYIDGEDVDVSEGPADSIEEAVTSFFADKGMTVAFEEDPERFS